MSGIICSIAGATYAAAVRSPNNGTATGSAVISTSRSKFGGASIYLPGAYVTLANDISFPDNQDFTWEFWVNEDVVQNCKYIGGQSVGDIFIGHDNYGVDTFSNRLAIGIVAVGWYIDFGVTLAADTWYHVCVQRSGDTVYGYTNGTLRVTHTGSMANIAWQWKKLQFSGERDGNTVMNGYQDEIRFSNIVRYATGGFTEPTAPFVNDANTVLLLHGNGSNNTTVFTDDVGTNAIPRTPNTVTAVGNAQVDTAQSQFGGASALFDGTGDRLETTIDLSQTGDFTYEFWFRAADTISNQGLLAVGNESTGRENIYLNGNNPRLNLYAGADNISSSTNISTNTWYHLAVVRSATTVTMYLAGSNVGSYTDSTQFGNSNGLYIADIAGGAISFNGHIDEVRVSNIARYTTTFTPSATAFTNDRNTLLLLHCNGTDASTTFTDDNVNP